MKATCITITANASATAPLTMSVYTRDVCDVPRQSQTHLLYINTLQATISQRGVDYWPGLVSRTAHTYTDAGVTCTCKKVVPDDAETGFPSL